MKRRIIILVLAVAGLVTSACAAEKIAKPSRGDQLIKRAYFGDSGSVNRLASLLGDDDPLVREKAVLDLGQTHNREAMPHIQRAFRDGEASVRAAAVQAAAELGLVEAQAIIQAALSDANGRVVLTALSNVRLVRLTDVKKALLELATAENRTIQPQAIRTLTKLGITVNSEQLAKFLQSEWLSVRLCALENTMLLASLANTTAVSEAAGSGKPAQRAAALAVLGKFNFSAAASHIAKAEKSDDPILRRGAVWAYQHAGKGDRIGPFLEDPSPLVRLAAIKAAGTTKAADCEGRLFELMISAPHELSHNACLDSLRAIAKPATAERASTWLKENGNDVVALGRRVAEQSKEKDVSFFEIVAKIRSLEVLQRNASSCCRLLARLKSRLAIDEMYMLLNNVRMDSPVLVALAEYFSTVTSEADTIAMAKLLDRLRIRCRQYLAALAAMQPPPPYDSSITVDVVKILAKLKSPDIELGIFKLATFTFGGTRQEVECSAAIREIRSIISPENTKALESDMIDIVDSTPLLTLQYEAAVCLGELKSKDALDALRKLLETKRPNKSVIQAAAWALQEITGETPNIPNPLRNEGPWLIRATRR